MGILKAIETETGAIGEYSLVRLTNIDWVKKQAHCEIETYISRDLFKNNKEPVRRFSFDIGSDVFDFLPEDNIVAKVYSKLKLLPDFEGYEDVLEPGQTIPVVEPTDPV